jgi:glutamine amidotransferase
MASPRVRLALIDYGAGNLRSIGRALALAGADVRLMTEAPADERVDGIVLPGVGAFGAAMGRLEAAGFPDWIRAQVADGIPLLGVCLGMQLLFARSEESPEAAGLGLVPGEVTRLPRGLKVPHMGWNQLTLRRPSPLLEGVADGSDVYFVHSYVARPRDERDVIATTTYGEEFPSVIQRGRLAGVQFHPEKSADTGQRLLRGAVAWFASAAAGTPASPP